MVFPVFFFSCSLICFENVWCLFLFMFARSFCKVFLNQPEKTILNPKKTISGAGGHHVFVCFALTFIRPRPTNSSISSTPHPLQHSTSRSRSPSSIVVGWKQTGPRASSSEPNVLQLFSRLSCTKELDEIVRVQVNNAVALRLLRVDKHDFSWSANHPS